MRPRFISLLLLAAALRSEDVLISLPGTSVPTQTWTKLQANGWPVGEVGYEKTVYSAAANCHGFIGVYHEGQGEPNQALGCFSFEEKRWSAPFIHGQFHTEYLPTSGHTAGLLAWMGRYGAWWTIGLNSGSNMVERNARTYWLDPIGQVSRVLDTGSLSNQRPVSGTNVIHSSVYDPYNDRVVIFPGFTGNSTVLYDPSTNLYTTVAGTNPPPRASFPNMVYNSLDHKVYLYGGTTAGPANCSATAFSTTLSTFDAATSAWATVTQNPDPDYGTPSGRAWNGLAFSPDDNVLLLAGGCNGSSAGLDDTWVFHLNTSTWEKLPSAGSFLSTVATPFERLSYDDRNKAFILAIRGNGATDYTGGTSTQYTTAVWAFCYSPCTKAGRASNSYAPAGGYVNSRFNSGAQPGSDTTSVVQGSAIDISLAASGDTMYLGYIDMGAPFDTNSSQRLRHPYVQSFTGGVWTNLGTDYSAISDFSHESELVQVAVINGVPWVAWSSSLINPINSRVYAKSWNGATWAGGEIGLINASPSYYQGHSRLFGSGITPTVAFIETYNAGATALVYVKQYSGGSWTGALGGGPLNIAAGNSHALFVDAVSDGANPWVCWVEAVVSGSSATYYTTAPQIYCKRWTGAAWSQITAGSLNINTSNWASDVAVTYLSGYLYVAWTERTTSGNPKLYVAKCDTTACNLIGSAISKDTIAGWAMRPRLANDGTNVYLAWEEQTGGLASPQRIFVQKYDGSSWSAMGGALNVDSAYGSAAYGSLAVINGNPAVAWGEQRPGNLRQVYVRRWSGSDWEPAAPLPGSLLVGASSVGGQSVLR